ncbi:PREDICTED: uncharacterized protein LOC109116462 [Tarenaya hassleriana]|uniref:uncharacterized protein LOC109116462 n=1 Tax=Tarenaya hassleriana TaxID=28532 RepID=UPI0008FD1279|nr:PREDICTED: uncharacterized protein LOC109116462 [Tarenaya hassleriana]
MLSGWSTHGRLACPFCMEETEAFQLRHGRKSCWFDCHRRFLPRNHPFRQNRTLFTKGRSKDNINSRKDLKDICKRKELELTRDGHAPVPIFRLTKPGKTVLFKWLKEEVKFSDGYASKLARCVDTDSLKLMGMKSHDCHVFMQRLIPIAFAELLKPSVHGALCGISTFFRDICTRSLRRSNVEMRRRQGGLSTKTIEVISTTMIHVSDLFPKAFSLLDASEANLKNIG